MGDPEPRRVTVADLEKVIADLKMEEFFAFGQDELNQGHGHWDVFPAVEDIDELDPTDEGDANEFLAWSDAAADAAFDERGVLRAPLLIHWGGSRAGLQMAFARVGLTVRIELDAAPRESYGASGTLVLSPRAGELDCDVRRMLRTFEQLATQGIVALGNAGFTQSDGWSDVATAAGGRDCSAVFWHEQGHDAFDGIGNLEGGLNLHWRGDAEAIIGTLRGAGFTVEDAPPEHTCICVVAGPTGEVGLEHASGLRAATVEKARPKRVVAPHAGPLELVHAFRSRDHQPVGRFAFDRRRPQRIAIAQEMDARGFPTAPAYVVEGDVERAALEGRRAMGVGGLCFLGDGRLLVCTTEQRKAKPEDTFPQSCLVLYGDDTELLCQGFSHVSDTSLLTVDEGERLVAIGQPQGADLYRVPAAGEPWPAPHGQLRVPDEPVRAYTRTAIAPDGSCVAWCDDWSAALACFDVGTGMVRWRHPEANSRRRDLGFTPDSGVIALQAGGREIESSRIELYAVDDGRAVHEELTAATLGVRSFAFHPSGAFLAIGRAGGVLGVYAFPEGTLVAETEVLTHGYVSGLAFDHDGTRLAVGGSKGDVGMFAFSSERTAAIAASAPPERTRRGSSLAAKGGDGLVGATGFVVDGAWRNHEAKVVQVGSGGAKLRVAIKMMGRDMTVDVDAADFRHADEIGLVSAESPYQIGDLVFVHAGYPAKGKEGTVVDVDERRGLVMIELPREDEYDEPEDLRATVELTELTLVRPLRRDPLPEYLAIFDGMRFRCGEQRPLQHWALMQLRAVDWDLDAPALAAGGALAQEFAAIEQRAWDEATAAHEQRRRELLATFEPLSHEQRVERWKTDWVRWAKCGDCLASPKGPEWDEIHGDDSHSRHKLDLVFALRDRFQQKPW